ncbi:MAG TPA: DUF5908 family protein [Kofleriaceae bacterium]
MAIEIKQLIIRAVIEDARPRPTAAPASRAVPGPVHPAAPSEPGVDRDALVAECTRHVLRELRKERGR